MMMNARGELMKVIEAQISTRNPPISAETLARLLRGGAARDVAISAMTDALFEHMKQMINDNEVFIESKYIERFNRIQIDAEK